MKKLEIIIILALIVIIGGGLYWLNKDNHISSVEEGTTQLSPTQVRSIKAIGQWEFLSISDEELVDTVRKGFFKDEELARIYYGTMRLGIDLKDAGEGWIQPQGDSIVCTLPPIKLLDHNFIDEAKTQSFFESGSWTGKDRQDMYERAYQAMKQRGLQKSNITRAEENAMAQFTQLFQAMGIKQVKVQFEGANNK